MQTALLFLCACIEYIGWAMYVLITVRALLSWFPISDDSKIVRFVYAATEWFIAPIRALLSSFRFFQNMPIDFSSLAAMLILILILNLLP